MLPFSPRVITISFSSCLLNEITSSKFFASIKDKASCALAKTISNLFLSFGVMLSLEGLCYLALPIDLIPDCIPLIGYADDGLAWLVIVIGGWCLLIGMIIYLGPYLLIEIFG